MKKAISIIFMLILLCQIFAMGCLAEATAPSFTVVAPSAAEPAEAAEEESTPAEADEPQTDADTAAENEAEIAEAQSADGESADAETVDGESGDESEPAKEGAEATEQTGESENPDVQLPVQPQEPAQTNPGQRAEDTVTVTEPAPAETQTVTISPDRNDTTGIVVVTNENGVWTATQSVFFGGVLPLVLIVVLLFLLLAAILVASVAIICRLR